MIMDVVHCDWYQLKSILHWWLDYRIPSHREVVYSTATAVQLPTSQTSPISLSVWELWDYGTEVALKLRFCHSQMLRNVVCNQCIIITCFDIWMTLQYTMPIHNRLMVSLSIQSTPSYQSLNNKDDKLLYRFFVHQKDLHTRTSVLDHLRYVLFDRQNYVHCAINVVFTNLRYNFYQYQPLLSISSNVLYNIPPSVPIKRNHNTSAILTLEELPVWLYPVLPRSKLFGLYSRLP